MRRSRMKEDLQKALRVDINFELDVAAFLRRVREPVAQVSREIEGARRFRLPPLPGGERWRA